MTADRRAVDPEAAVDPNAAAKRRYAEWWAGRLTRGPLIHLVARLGRPLEPLEPVAVPDGPQDRYLSIERKTLLLRNRLRTHRYLADALPILDTSTVSGSLALYLGIEPKFAEETAWHCHDASVLDGRPLPPSPAGVWWKLQLDLTRRALALADSRMLIGEPNLHENLDALADITGAESLCYALMDRPELIQRLVAHLDTAYFACFDTMHDLLAAHNGGACYAAKWIWGPGRTAKIQCDFAALISPAQFRRYVQPSLRAQCAHLDRTMYHLDGPAALRHLDAVLEIEELDALQFTPGAGERCASHPDWLPVYERARRAGKSVQVELSAHSHADWHDNAARLVDQIGPGALYLVCPDVTERQGDEVLRLAERWR